ncbi:hypothetical protein LSAT2_018882 [Lamellibrachia satsuma]|nr:hypothetical protein LSAT2_018882 [Lamellibrachia satsuma]
MTAPAATVYWLHVVLICSLVVGRHSFSIQEGGLLTQDLKLQKWASPITVKGDVFVHKDVTLSIAAGVVMRFAPGVMLAVNGTLKAEGLPDDRIIMTRMDAPEFMTTAWPGDIRLVDDQSVMYGRLQILYRGRWRGICANSQNWTQTDTDVACRQLGFLEGIFSFVSWARNDSRFMLYHQPDCSGSESNILDCAGSQRIQIGSRICVQQKTIHLHCYGLAPQSTAASNWWGLEFYNATLRPVIKGSIAIYESNSVLENVDILYAGLDPLGNPVPAVRASPTVPRLDGVAIRYCALDATNFTDINASTIVHNSDFELNRGHGLVVESRFGRINVTDSRVVANSGNGIKAKLLDSKFLIIDEQKAFCRRVNTGGYQQFPQVISGIPFRQFRTSCDKYFPASMSARHCRYSSISTSQHLCRLVTVTIPLSVLPSIYVCSSLSLFFYQYFPASMSARDCHYSSISTSQHLCLLVTVAIPLSVLPSIYVGTSLSLFFYQYFPASMSARHCRYSSISTSQHLCWLVTVAILLSVLPSIYVGSSLSLFFYQYFPASMSARDCRYSSISTSQHLCRLVTVTIPLSVLPSIYVCSSLSLFFYQYFPASMSARDCHYSSISTSQHLCLLVTVAIPLSVLPSIYVGS